MSLRRVCTQWWKNVVKQQVMVVFIREHSRFRGLKRHIEQPNTIQNNDLEEHRVSRLNFVDAQHDAEVFTEAPRDYLHIYPDFLPEPDEQKRDRLLEKLTRKEMYRRRNVIEIPEFYVGSILAVTIADETSPTKQNRFVGICIHRFLHMLRHCFILRNAIDGEGVEIVYELYSPLIQKIEVLKLEKRLDNSLIYLRDCPLEYSHVPLDMEPVPLPKGMAVPVNTVKVKLNPPPWYERWERVELKGVLNNTRKLNAKQQRREELSRKPWEKYDLMLHYRQGINDVEQDTISMEVYKMNTETEERRRKQKMKARKKED